MTSKLCPICESGELSSLKDKIEVSHLGITGHIYSQYSECNFCGSEQATTDDVRTNKRAMVSFKKEVLGLLTGSQVRIMRKKLGLTQAESAKVFGGGDAAFSKYETDDIIQSEAMDKLLRVSYAVPAAFEILLNKANVSMSSDQTYTTVTAVKQPQQINYGKVIIHRDFEQKAQAYA